MDFLENVKSVVSDGARAVAKKSGELVEASKIQYAPTRQQYLMRIVLKKLK